jgi:hypothetical protein
LCCGCGCTWVVLSQMSEDVGVTSVDEAADEELEYSVESVLCLVDDRLNGNNSGSDQEGMLAGR